MESRMVRLSTRAATRNEMREGKLALMRPVSTSTDGRWVARIRWMPTARAIWARRVIDSSTSCERDHHQVGQLVDDDHDVVEGLQVLARPRPALRLLGPDDVVELLDVAHALRGELADALLHLAPPPT